VTLTDPAGDDYGPGDYVYPYDGVFTPGSFDIIRFRAYDQGSNIKFEVEIDGELSDPWGSGAGFSLQSLDIYIDQDGVEGSGATWALERRNVTFSSQSAWEYVIWCQAPFEGFDTHVIDQYGTEYYSGISVDADQGTDVITITVPKSTLGTPDTGWHYAVLMLSQAGFEQGRVRPVMASAGTWVLGGGDDGQSDGNVIDMVAGSGVSQESLLANYNPLTLVGPIIINRVDAVAPAITYSAPSTWEEHQMLSVDPVIDDDVVVSARLYYRTPGDSYTEVEMWRTSERDWIAAIPGSEITQAGLEFYLSATDGINSSELPSAASPFAVTVTPDVTPPAFTYLAASPDPFSPNGDTFRDTTTITAALSEPSYLWVSVEDSLGGHVRTLLDSVYTEAARAVGWDGKDELNHLMAEGTYTVRARARDLAGYPSPAESTTVVLTMTDEIRQLDVILLFHANQNLVPYGRVGNISCYEGVMEVLRAHPSSRFALHFSGCLISDLMWSDPYTMDLLREGVSEGQFEIIGSTYAQNIMYSTRVSDTDFQFNQHQIAFHKQQIEDVVGASPVSFWNAERVWTQNFVELLSGNGYTNVQIEDHILWDSGISGSEYFVRTTTYGGETVNVFTDDKTFQGYVNGSVDSGDTASVMAFLRMLYDEDVDDRMAVCYYEDMEASGLWDYEGGNHPAGNWNNLDKLITAFESDPRIRVTTYTEWLESHDIYEDITPVVDGAADWMGRDAWFLENAEPLAESYRVFWDGIRDTLNAVHETFTASAPDTVVARALLDHAWFTLIAHQYEFAVAGYSGIAGTTQWELARCALVSARASREALLGAPRTYVDDVNDDGIDEVVLVTDTDFFVFSRYGGRLLYWFDLEFGKEYVGNENFMRSYGESYTNDNAYVTEAVGTEAYPWLSGNYIFPEVHAWTFEARRRALNDFIWVDSVDRSTINTVMSYTTGADYVEFTYGLPGVHVAKRMTGGTHELDVVYTFTSTSPSTQDIVLQIENGLSPDCLLTTLWGRETLRYWDGADTSWAFTPSTRGVANVPSDCAVFLDFTDEPDAITGDDNTFGLEVNPEWNFQIAAFGIETIGFSLDLRSAAGVIVPEPDERQGLRILPNPTMGQVGFSFRPASVSGSEVAIFDLAGRLVRSIPAPASAEPVTVTWDGLNETGERVATGIYLVKVTSGAETAYGKVAIVR
jgi:flagellar hook assembly protein FlgD